MVAPPKWHCSYKTTKALDYIYDPKSEDDTFSLALQDKLLTNNGVELPVASQPEQQALPDVPSFESASPDKKEIKQEAAAAYDMSVEAIKVAQEAKKGVKKTLGKFKSVRAIKAQMNKMAEANKDLKKELEKLQNKFTDLNSTVSAANYKVEERVSALEKKDEAKSVVIAQALTTAHEAQAATVALTTRVEVVEKQVEELSAKTLAGLANIDKAFGDLTKLSEEKQLRREQDRARFIELMKMLEALD